MRVVLAQPRGFCAGVERAIEIVERALEKYGPPIYVRHEIVHNRHVVERLRAKGAHFVDEIDEIPPGSVTIFSAHGVASAIEERAGARGLPVIDATCPLVSKVHIEGQRYANQGREIILIGHAGHPEIVGTMGRIVGRVHLISTPKEVAGLRVSDPDKLAFITQTTLSVDDTRAVIEALKVRFPIDRRPRHQGHLLRDAEPPARGARARRGRRRRAGGRRAEQLELEPAARDRRRKRRAELSDRRRRGARPATGSKALGGRHHRRRLGAGRAGRGADRPAARDRPRSSSRSLPGVTENVRFRMPPQLADDAAG